MAWQDRLQPARYVAPSGKSITFQYEDVSRVTTKKTSAWSFPDVDGTYVQDLGAKGKRYPLRVFISGNDYDLEAERLETLLSERGAGRLEHPLYGNITVVPFGDITRRDNLKTAANQAIFDITFFETIPDFYPFPATDLKSQIDTKINESIEASANEFASVTSLDTVVSQVQFKPSFSTALNGVRQNFNVITQSQKTVNDEFNNIYNSLNTGLDFLVAQPATLAFQTNILLKTPGLLINSLEARVDGYKNVIQSSITQSLELIKGANDFKNRDLYATGALIGYVQSVANWSFSSKPEALTTAEDIQSTFADVLDWRDTAFDVLGLTDTGEFYQRLQELVALTTGFLVQLSFSLDQERRIVLDRNRSIIDLTAELYGEVDSKLDFFINSNNLTGSEILEVPKGKEIVYFTSNAPEVHSENELR